MDPNTNTPTDSDEPKPLGGPLHPPEPVDSTTPDNPSIMQPSASVSPDPNSQVFTPSTPSSTPPMPPAPLQSNTFTPPSDVIMPTQNPVSAPLTPTGLQPPFPGADVTPAASAPGLPPSPAAPVIVSGGFASGAPAGPVVGTVSPTFSAPGQPQAPLTPPSASKTRGLKPMLIALAAIIVIAGGSAAAYFGVIAPNQPANVLKTALVNSLKQNSASYKGTITLAQSGGSSSSYQLDLSGSRNASEKASDVTLSFDGYGVKVSFEARLANQNLYLKAGDLSTLAGLVGSFEPSLSSAATTISGDVSNQWIEVDSATLNEIGASCVINAASGPVTQADINTLTADYAKNGFLDIEKTSSATVNGQAAEKFSVNIDDNKGASFLSGLNNLSGIKSMEACKDGSALSSSFKQIKGDGKQTPLTLWVSKANKQIIEVSASDTPQQITQTHLKSTVDINLSYNNVSIPAPANSESFVQLYTKLAPTLNSLSSSGLDLSNLSSL